jgi:hypothetical protein
LTVDDIRYHQQGTGSPESRVTLHHFISPESLGVVISAVAPNNSDAQQPQDTSNWPPPIILDFVYASAALNAWGENPFKENVRKVARDLYYDDAEGDGDTPDDDAPGGGTSDQPTTRSAQLAARNTAKTQSVPLAGQSTEFSEMMDGVLALWMQSARKRQPRQPCNHDNILAWLQKEE